DADPAVVDAVEAEGLAAAALTASAMRRSCGVDNSVTGFAADGSEKGLGPASSTDRSIVCLFSPEDAPCRAESSSESGAAPSRAVAIGFDAVRLSPPAVSESVPDRLVRAAAGQPR